jgi:hypothetical protein
VTNSLRLGTGAGTTYAGASALSDSIGNDQGSYEAGLSRVVFCGDSGVAPSTAGSLYGGQAVSFFFQVKVMSNSLQPFVARMTNKDTIFDGSIVATGPALYAGILKAGDTASMDLSASLSISLTSNDGYVSWAGDGTYAAALAGNMMVGNNDGGPVGSDYDRVSYLSFTLTNIPPGANITAATLFVKVAVAGSVTGGLTADHVYYSNIWPDTLDLTARYQLSAPRRVLSSAYWTGPTVFALNDVALINSTAAVQVAQANPKGFRIGGCSRIFQVRLRDAVQLNVNPGDNNKISLFSMDGGGAGDRPALRVYYTSPGSDVAGFTGFDLSGVTNISTNSVSSAKLKIYRIAVSNSPSAVKVDHIDYGATLTAGDYSSTVVAGQSNIGTIASGTGWAEVDVTAAAKYAMRNNKSEIRNGHFRWLEARLRPVSTTPSDYSKDVLVFGGAEDAGYQAYLELTYLAFAPPPAEIVNMAVLNAIYATNRVTVLAPTGTTVKVSKSTTNTTLKGSPSSPKPGATVNYRIICSNKTAVAGVNTVVYDRIENQYVAFATNSAVGSGWTVEYSTNQSPIQTYVSADYSATQPSPDKVRWIRFRTPSMPGNSSVLFRYNVKIR